MPKKPLWLRETENKRAVELEPAVERERAGAKVRKAAENKRAVELERARNEYAEELRAINADEWMRARTWILDEEWPSAPCWGDTDDLVDLTGVVDPDDDEDDEIFWPRAPGWEDTDDLVDLTGVVDPYDPENDL